MFKYSLLLLLFLTLSCEKSKQVVTEKKIAGNKNLMHVDFEFPDTVYQNQIYTGKIRFRNYLDTVKLDKHKNEWRFTYYSFKVTKKLEKNETILKMDLDTIPSREKNIITLPEFKFSRLGVTYIDGIIHDEVMLKTKDSIRNRYITNEIRATHKVVVIDGNVL